MRFATDDRVTVTDPSDRHYDEEGRIIDYHYGFGKNGKVMYVVELDGRATTKLFTVDQLDFTNPEVTNPEEGIEK